MKEIFNEIFREEGGFYDHTQYPWYESIITHCNLEIKKIKEDRPSFPSVEIGLVNNPTLNAAVCKANHKYYIGVNIGVYFLLQDIFYRMLCNKNILIEFGDVSKEVDVKKLYDPQLDNAENLFFDKDFTENITPKDEVRANLARFFVAKAFTFLCYHEYGHIIFGHLDLIAANKGNFKISEIDNKLTLSMLDSQTLEFDADIYATNMMMKYLLKEHVKYYQENTKSSSGPNLPSTVQIHFFAIYTLFRLFGIKKESYNNLLSFPHPPPGIRQRLILDQILFPLRAIPDLVQKLEIILPQTINEVENAFQLISEVDLFKSEIENAYSKTSSGHLYKVLRNWNNLRPILEQYSYGELSPLKP
jgi:hypothetical protein